MPEELPGLQMMVHENRAFAEQLEEGEMLTEEKFESINYYKDYSFKKKSYIQEKEVTRKDRTWR